jgi:8-oxo-dGTP pyrophosphatase MutT (NUDIX family)
MGVACCRRGPKGTEILLIRKRFTYAFSEFVHGRYSSSSNDEILELLNMTTVEEKVDLMSMCFSQIWYRIWLNSRHRANYVESKLKFESTFLRDGGVRLRRLLAAARHATCIWEIPKGRKNGRGESSVQCAAREFYEETAVGKNSYRLLPGAVRLQQYMDSGTQYINKYFIAVAKHRFEPRISFARKEQVDELGDIRWMTLCDIAHADPTGRLSELVRPIIHYVRIHA